MTFLGTHGKAQVPLVGLSNHPLKPTWRHRVRYYSKNSNLDIIDFCLPPPCPPTRIIRHSGAHGFS